jgi:mono/diheme cytochrome c family protein
VRPRFVFIPALSKDPHMKSLTLGTPAAVVASVLIVLGGVAAGWGMGPRAAWAQSIKSNNPLSGNPEAIAAGQKAFRSGFCSQCHGMNATGAGRGAPNAANLQKFKRGYFAFVKTVKEGYKTMPPWGGGPVLDDETINQIGAWLESLAQPEAVWTDPS